jgi:hypothetical protein
MQPRREKTIVIALMLLFLALISVPYLLVAANAAPGNVFGGFLLNRLDGNSYLAKMLSGYQGNWLFVLPYTAEPGVGTAINVYYLFLGHTARVLGTSLIFMFHAARWVGASLLGLALYRFFARVFRESGARLTAFGLALFGSGMGWVAVAFGFFSSDFWLAEAYPFLAADTNAHFALGLALQVWLLTPLLEEANKNPHFGLTAIAAALLAIVYPFGWALSAGLLSLWVIYLAISRGTKREEIFRWVAVLAGGAPVAVYQLWAVNTHPVLMEWNAQNLTPAPGLLDLAISFSPALLLAIAGGIIAWRSEDGRLRFLLLWVMAGMVVIYLPFSLQRRLITGLYIPIAGLATLAVWQLGAKQRRWLLPLLFLFSLPTNLLISLSGSEAIRTQDPAIYLSSIELQAFAWLDQNAAGALVMAAPDSGTLIPAYSAARVLYGHPFETVHAEVREAEVGAFYERMSPAEAMDYLQKNSVDFVLFGPRERALGKMPQLDGWQIVYEVDDLQIWARSG